MSFAKGTGAEAGTSSKKLFDFFASQGESTAEIAILFIRTEIFFAVFALGICAVIGIRNRALNTTVTTVLRRAAFVLSPAGRATIESHW